MRFLLVAILGYLIGALPVAYLVTRLLTGRDLRRLGTGNVGVMNTIRQAGLPAGMIVFLAEGGKGAAAVALGRALTRNVDGALLAALLALIGVNWSVFVGFAGGRGSTLCVFVCLVIAPWVLLGSAAVWLAVYTLRRDNFIATRVNIIAFPLLTLAITHRWTFFVFASLACLVVLLRHDRRTDDHYQLAVQPVRHDD
ncbi:MAG TPA: glycerol-3-phosphate acyltransferase [Dehalococcoidia bacterium]|nr:glycerol-3-phosphate acyltransferase [Dehalococcoidia bacterium]